MSGYDPCTGEEIDYEAFFKSGAHKDPAKLREAIDNVSLSSYFKDYKKPKKYYAADIGIFLISFIVVVFVLSLIF